MRVLVVVVTLVPVDESIAVTIRVFRWIVNLTVVRFMVLVLLVIRMSWLLIGLLAIKYLQVATQGTFRFVVRF